jgi:hypothetical protein
MVNDDPAFLFPEADNYFTETEDSDLKNYRKEALTWLGSLYKIKSYLSHLR